MAVYDGIIKNRGVYARLYICAIQDNYTYTGLYYVIVRQIIVCSALLCPAPFGYNRRFIHIQLNTLILYVP